MRRIKILQIMALLFAVNSMALAAMHQQSSPVQANGQLSGIVVDANESRIAGATVTVEGKDVKRVTTTAEDGTYKFELPSGVYRIRASSGGFCPSQRAPFRVLPLSSIELNLSLTVCPIINSITIVNGQYVGETDRYRDPFKEEAFPLTHPSGVRLELLVRYGERREDKSIIEYQRATASYDALTIRADRVRLDPVTFRLEAEGNVIAEDGKRCVRARRAVVELKKSEPKLELTP